jgi:hypothetical protein
MMEDHERSPMSDIVERLRAPAYWISGSSEGHEGDNSAPLEAAATITTLRADHQKLNERNAEYIGTIDRLRRRVAETDVEIERLSEANEMMLTDIRRTDVDMLAFKAEIERLRAALLVGVCMLSEMGLDPREKCQMAYDHLSAALAQEKPHD